MKRETEGSILLLLVIIITVCTIYATNVLQTTNYMMDIAINRLKKQQHYYATLALLNYGIALSMDSFTTLTKEAEHDTSLRVCTVTPWLPHGLSDCSGVLEVKPHADHIDLVAILNKKDQKLVTMSCSIHKKKQKIVVSKWSNIMS